MVANIVPVAPSNMLYVTELEDFFEQLPSLSADDSLSFSKDIEDIRVNITTNRIKALQLD